MRQIEDGRTPEEQTIEMFLPVSKDTEGNLMVKNDGEWVTIANSKDVDWNMVVTNPNDARINWPTTGDPEQGVLSMPQYYLSIKADDGSNSTFLKPGILLDKKVGQVYLKHQKDTGFLKFITIETDEMGNPIAARLSLITQLLGNLYEEGISLEIKSPSKLKDGSQLVNALQENQVYYIVFSGNQK